MTKVTKTLCVRMEKMGPDADVTPSHVEITTPDAPVPEQFLSFLSTDLAQHPERLQTIDASLVQRIRSLVGGIDVDLNTALLPKQAPKP